MNWFLKSKAVLGVVVTALGAILGFLGTIEPELAKLLEGLGVAVAALGIRAKQERDGAGQ